MQLELTPETLVSAASGQISSPLGDETVILQLENGQYFGLNAVGTRMWELIQQPRPLSEITRIILSEYDVSPAALELDLQDIVTDLVGNGLAVVQAPAP